MSLALTPKTRLSELIRKADQVISRFVINRDKKCVVCGSQKDLTNGHLIHRGKKSVRYSLKNCNCQCVPCNNNHECDPQPYTEWFIKKHGQPEYDKLKTESNKLKHFTKTELVNLINQHGITESN